MAGILGLALLACGGDKETTPEPVETPVAGSPTTAPAATSRPLQLTYRDQQQRRHTARQAAGPH